MSFSTEFAERRLRLRQVHKSLFWRLQMAVREQIWVEAFDLCQQCLGVPRTPSQDGYIIRMAFNAALATENADASAAVNWTKLSVGLAGEVGDHDMRQKGLQLLSRLYAKENNWFKVLVCVDLLVDQSFDTKLRRLTCLLRQPGDSNAGTVWEKNECLTQCLRSASGLQQVQQLHAVVRDHGDEGMGEKILQDGFDSLTKAGTGEQEQWYVWKLTLTLEFSQDAAFDVMVDYIKWMHRAVSSDAGGGDATRHWSATPAYKQIVHQCEARIRALARSEVSMEEGKANENRESVCRWSEALLFLCQLAKDDRGREACLGHLLDAMIDGGRVEEAKALMTTHGLSGGDGEAGPAGLLSLQLRLAMKEGNVGLIRDQLKRLTHDPRGQGDEARQLLLLEFFARGSQHLRLQQWMDQPGQSNSTLFSVARNVERWLDSGVSGSGSSATDWLSRICWNLAVQTSEDAAAPARYAMLAVVARLLVLMERNIADCQDASSSETTKTTTKLDLSGRRLNCRLLQMASALAVLKNNRRGLDRRTLQDLPKVVREAEQIMTLSLVRSQNSAGNDKLLRLLLVYKLSLCLLLPPNTLPDNATAVVNQVCSSSSSSSSAAAASSLTLQLLSAVVCAHGGQGQMAARWKLRLLNEAIRRERQPDRAVALFKVVFKHLVEREKYEDISRTLEDLLKYLFGLKEESVPQEETLKIIVVLWNAGVYAELQGSETVGRELKLASWKLGLFAENYKQHFQAKMDKYLGPELAGAPRAGALPGAAEL